MDDLSAGTLLLAAALAYLVASVAFGAAVLRDLGRSHPRLATIGLWAVAVGCVLHTLSIGARCSATGISPVADVPEMLSACGWAIAAAFLVLQLFMRRDTPSLGSSPSARSALGALSMPLAFLSVFCGAAIERADPGPVASPALQLADDKLINLHVVAILFAFGLLAVAFGCALLYLVEDRLLKRKRLTQLFSWRLPPLAALDDLAFSLVAVAFPLLTVGMLAGVVRAVVGPSAAGWAIEPHTVVSVVTWGVYGAYLWLRAGLAWRGAGANALLVLGLAMALATYALPSSLHQGA